MSSSDREVLCVRVGIMWRHYGERGGIAVYTDAIVRELLARDDGTEYVLFVRPGARPPYESRRLRIREVAARSRLAWDQVALPVAAAKLWSQLGQFTRP